MANNPYTPPILSGYNLNPPPDDDSESASNAVQWQKHLDKIGDPLRTFANDDHAATTAAFASTINTGADENNSMAGSLAFTPSELTLDAAGAIAPLRSHHTVDTFADAATDDLVTVTTGGVSDGAMLILRQENAAREVTVKTTGNIVLRGAEFTLSTTAPTALLRVGTNWYELQRPEPIFDWRLLNTSVLTSDTTLDLATIFSDNPGRQKFEIEFEDIILASATAAAFQMRLSVDGSTFDIGANYGYSLSKQDPGAAASEIRGESQTIMRMGDNLANQNTAGFGLGGRLVWENPLGSYNRHGAYLQLTGRGTAGTGHRVSYTGIVDYTPASPPDTLTGFQLINSITSGMTGTVRVYGR